MILKIGIKYLLLFANLACLFYGSRNPFLMALNLTASVMMIIGLYFDYKEIRDE